MLSSARFLWACVVVACAACNRYEYRQPTCPTSPPPRDSVRAAPAAPGRVEGVVVDVDGGALLRAAAVLVEPVRRGAYTDSAGRFAVDTLPPGVYRLVVRRVGYRARRVDSVRVTAAAGATVHIPLTLAPLDGCPGFMVVQVRKPWWKVW